MILLVEGEDDEHVVEHLYREVFDSEPPFKISNEQGYSKLLKTLPLHLRGSGLLALGVLADANDDPAERWREIVDVAAEEGVRLPGAPDPSGTVVGDRPRVGVWLMPDNQGPGELEDFALKLIPGSDRVWPLAKSYVEGIPEKDRGFKPGKISKAKLYAWLASRELPQRMGAAITAGDLDAQAPLAQGLAKWLADLFGE